MGALMATYDAEWHIRNAVADNAIARVCNRARRTLITMPASGLAGDDCGLRNVWDELCVQLQYDQSPDWWAFEITVRQVIEGVMLDLAGHEKLAIWLDTDQGRDWQWEDEDKRESPPNVDDQDVALYIQRSHLYPMAKEWSNTRIRNFIQRLFELD
jgi:hypothetical protein